ncbi:hypothetical protein KM043_013654 [Ampulex compressa]|nr:hypothetical protein KM043_013654 [Ampulex compressa]
MRDSRTAVRGWYRVYHECDVDGRIFRGHGRVEGERGKEKKDDAASERRNLSPDPYWWKKDSAESARTAWQGDARATNGIWASTNRGLAHESALDYYVGSALTRASRPRTT